MYDYDLRGRKVCEGVATYPVRYAYGYICNRLSLVELGTNHLYTANSLNQSRAISNAVDEAFVPVYDADGNQILVKTATGTWSVTYNGENRPIRWENGDTVITMSFDRMGCRVTKNTQRFVYSGYLQIADNADNTYIWDPTEEVATRPLVWTRNGVSSYYDFDGNKNVSEVIDSDGTLAAHYEYAPFGALTISRGESPAANPWRFSSEYAEDETATVYYNYRHYEPGMGRWLGRGPLAGALAAVVAGNSGPQVFVPEEILTVPVASITGFVCGCVGYFAR